MPLIEGIGDEVTIIIGLFLLCIVLMLAWLSTHTADIPLIREVGVIVVELSQRTSWTMNSANQGSPRDQGTSRDDAGTSRDEDANREPDRISTEAERYELDNRSNESLDLHPEEGSNPTNPSEGENVDSPSQTSASPPMNNSKDQNALSSKSSQSHLVQPSGQEDSESLVPKASVVVDDKKGFNFGAEHLSEDEVRQRRVQYFESNQAGQSGSTENSVASSLSQAMPADDSSTRHLNTERIQLENLPLLDQGKTASQENSSSTSHQVPRSSQEPDSSASNSLPQDSTADHTPDEGTNSSRIRVKLKYMNESQRLVYASPLDTIGDFRRAHFQEELQENRWVRFIYNGHDLRDDAQTLQACNIGDNCTIHCLILARVQSTPTHAVAEDDDDSFMGAMMYPLFTVVILIVWYFRFTYRQYFSAMSTVCLIGISFLLALSYISSLRTVGGRTPAQQRTGHSAGSSPGSSSAAGGSNNVQDDHPHLD